MHPVNNHIDLSTFVALGDSLTAGYKDGALFYEGQVNSYPNLIAQQFGVSFKQPLLDPDSVGVGFFGNSRLVLEKEMGSNSSKLLYLAPQGDIKAVSENCYFAQGPFNNFGVPGAKAITLVAKGYGNKKNGEGNYNPFFSRMASDPENTSVLSDAMAIKPTFFSLFIGNNDVLAYALSGGTTDVITPLTGPAGVGFEKSLNLIIETLTSNGAHGVMCNLPGFNSAPIFNTIPYNGLLLDNSKAEMLNSRFSSQGIKFYPGNNPFILEDPFIASGIRKIEIGELISLDVLLDENKNNYLNGSLPIPKKYYLSKIQVENIKAAIAAYNNVIAKIAFEKKITLVDLNQLLKTLKPDRIYDPANLTIKYKTRGVFALDGLHINSLGHALLANEFIKAINLTYGSNVKKVSLTKFRQHNNKVKTN